MQYIIEFIFKKAVFLDLCQRFYAYSIDICRLNVENVGQNRQPVKPVNTTFYPVNPTLPPANIKRGVKTPPQQLKL